MNKDQLKRYGIVVGLMAVFFVFGIYLGIHSPVFSSLRAANESEQMTGADFGPFWKVWKLVNEKYPEAQAADQDKVWGAIQGLVGSLGDPYSFFLPPQEAKDFEESIQGEFSGAGMVIDKRDNILTVISPIKGTPADKAGIKAGDKILRIDDEITTDMTIDEAVSRIKGERGTSVTLTILHEGEDDPEEIRIVRDIIQIPTIETEEKRGAFIISIYSFNDNSPELFQEALQAFDRSGSDKLVLDLRGNPGGYLESAVEMSSWFLPAGKAVVIEDYGKEHTQKAYRSRGYDAFGDDLRMVVLVDGGSASAAEIMAGALQEHGKAVLVGTKTFGKGSVQELVPVTRTTALKITVAKWLTPNGRSISKEGLAPDIEVKASEEDLAAGRDPQMEKALEILNSR